MMWIKNPFWRKENFQSPGFIPLDCKVCVVIYCGDREVSAWIWWLFLIRVDLEKGRENVEQIFMKSKLFSASAFGEREISCRLFFHVTHLHTRLITIFHVRRRAEREAISTHIVSCLLRWRLPRWWRERWCENDEKWKGKSLWSGKLSLSSWRERRTWRNKLLAGQSRHIWVSEGKQSKASSNPLQKVMSVKWKMWLNETIVVEIVLMNGNENEKLFSLTFRC